MSLEVLEDRLIDLEKLTYSLAREVNEKQFGKSYAYCIDILSKIKTPTAIISKDYKIIYMNEASLKHIEEDLGKKQLHMGKLCYKEIFGIDSVCDNCAVKKSIEERRVYISNYESKKGTKYLIICVPLIYNGTSGAIEIFVPQ